MARKVFYSFHYKPDNWRASQVRNIGVVEGNPPCSDNDWEDVTNGGNSAIQKWIDGQLSGRSCTVVLIGSGTAGRKWINYEIEKAWNDKMGLVGIHIHGLLNRDKRQSAKGSNPFAEFTLSGGKQRLSNVVKAYDPPYPKSTDVYAHIEKHLETWIEEAITIRNNYKPS